MKRKQWIILICIAVVLAWIVVWLYYYSCTEVSTQSAICTREDGNCTLNIEPTEKYCSFYNIPYKLWLKNTPNEKQETNKETEYEECLRKQAECLELQKKWFREGCEDCDLLFNYLK